MKLARFLFEPGQAPSAKAVVYLNSMLSRAKAKARADLECEIRPLSHNAMDGADYLIPLDNQSLITVTSGNWSSIEEKAGNIGRRGGKVIMPLPPLSKLEIRNRKIDPKNRFYFHIIEKFLYNMFTFSGYPQHNLYVVGKNCTFEDFTTHISRMGDDDVLFFDIETDYKEQLLCLSFCYDGVNAYCIPIKEGDAIEASFEHLESPLIPKGGQNLSFDACFLRRYNYCTVSNIAEDTMTAQNVLYPGFPKGLGFLTSFYTPFNNHKQHGDLYEYNAYDSLVCWHIFKEQRALLGNRGLMKSYRDQICLIEPLMRLSADGVEVDEEELSRKKAAIALTLHNIEKDIGFPYRSKQALHDYFYVQKKYPKVTSRGKPIVTKAAIEKIYKKRADVKAGLILNALSLRNKINNTYGKNLLDDRGRISPAYKPSSVPSGIITSGANIDHKGVSMESLDSDFLSLFKLEEGEMIYALSPVITHGDFASHHYTHLGNSVVEVSNVQVFTYYHERTAKVIEDCHKLPSMAYKARIVQIILGMMDAFAWHPCAVRHGAVYAKCFSPNFPKIVVEAIREEMKERNLPSIISCEKVR